MISFYKPPLQQRDPKLPGEPPVTLATPFLDIFVLHAAVLVNPKEQAETIRRILQLAQQTRQSLPACRGPWLLVMTHNYSERKDAEQLTLALATMCQGVRAVTESASASTGRAALALHRLAFPQVADKERPARIIVLGSARERSLFGGEISTKEPA